MFVIMKPWNRKKEHAMEPSKIPSKKYEYEYKYKYVCNVYEHIIW